MRILYHYLIRRNIVIVKQKRNDVHAEKRRIILIPATVSHYKAG